MEPGTLPTEKAFVPDDPAHQPMEDAMTPRLERQPSRRVIRFTGDTDLPDKPSSQKSSANKDALSQPAPGLSHRQRLLWLQQRRTTGLWAQCDECNKWRYLPHILDRYQLPEKWYCRMNPDDAFADCSVAETPIHLHEEEDLIHSEYSAGSVVWARMAGWPWWPALVDDCPDTEQFYWLDGFSDIPTHYHVVFFDSVNVTRAWIASNNLKPYAANKKCYIPVLKNKKYKHRLQTAMNQADDAVQLSLADRLQKYSFLARYKGDFKTPKKLNKKALEKHAKYLKRKFNIQFDADSDKEEDWIPKSVKNKNVIVLGTPKKPKTRNVSKGKNVAPKSIEKSKSVSKNKEKTETGSTDQTAIFKESISLVAQKGSAVNSVMATESFDNDTSKTYLPERNTEESAQSTTITNTVSSEITEFQVATPDSDFFDF